MLVRRVKRSWMGPHPPSGFQAPLLPWSLSWQHLGTFLCPPTPSVHPLPGCPAGISNFMPKTDLTILPYNTWSPARSSLNKDIAHLACALC